MNHWFVPFHTLLSSIDKTLSVGAGTNHAERVAALDLQSGREPHLPICHSLVASEAHVHMPASPEPGRSGDSDPCSPAVSLRLPAAAAVAGRVVEPRWGGYQQPW